MASQNPVRPGCIPLFLASLPPFLQIRRKLVIVGDGMLPPSHCPLDPLNSYITGACGKTSLLCSFALGEFPKEYVRSVRTVTVFFLIFSHFSNQVREIYRSPQSDI